MTYSFSHNALGSNSTLAQSARDQVATPQSSGAIYSITKTVEEAISRVRLVDSRVYELVLRLLGDVPPSTLGSGCAEVCPDPEGQVPVLSERVNDLHNALSELEDHIERLEQL